MKSVKGTVNDHADARAMRRSCGSTSRASSSAPAKRVKAFVTYRPFRSGDAIMPVEFDLPRDLPEGTYQFTISGWEQFLSDERTAKPFRFSAESIEDVFGVLRDIGAIRHDAVYMRLIRQPDGIAIGRTAMRSLPRSRREVLLGAGRSNTTPFVNSTMKVDSREAPDGRRRPVRDHHRQERAHRNRRRQTAASRRDAATVIAA